MKHTAIKIWDIPIGGNLVEKDVSTKPPFTETKRTPLKRISTRLQVVEQRALTKLMTRGQPKMHLEYHIRNE